MKAVTNIIVELKNYAHFVIVYCFNYLNQSNANCCERILGVGFPCVCFSYYFTFNFHLFGQRGLCYFF